jgi:hypothetical protein
VLAEIYEGALSAKKFNVSKKLNIGARAAVFPALERGDLTQGHGHMQQGDRRQVPAQERRGLKSLYGVEFKRFRPLDVAGPLTVSALKAGKVDCANLFSTQSAIPANGFISLEDPKGLAHRRLPLGERLEVTATARRRAGRTLGAPARRARRLPCAG